MNRPGGAIASKPGRNDPCRCGSGRKYKRCCLGADEAREREERRLEQQSHEHVHGPDCDHD